MKVAFCIRKDYLTKMGGDTIQCINTKVNLEQKFNLHIDIVNDPNDLNTSYNIIHIFNLATVVETRNFFLKAKALKTPKVVLSPIFWNYKYTAIKDIAKAFNYSIPTIDLQIKLAIILIKTLAILIRKPWIMATPFKNFCKDCLMSSDLLLPNSIEELHELAKFTGLKFENLIKKSHIVLNASKFSELAGDNYDFLEQFNLPQNYILQVGRIEFTKNQINVVRALYNRPEIPIVFVGRSSDPIYDKKIKKIASRRGNVYFIDEIPNEKVSAFYRKASLHILPSFRESPGLVSLEALSQECKAVVANRRFTPVDTYFNSYVTIINPSSIKSIRRGIMEELSANRDMKKIKDHIITKFSWENAAKASYEAYQKLRNQF